MHCARVCERVTTSARGSCARTTTFQRQWVPAAGRLAVCASHAPRSLGSTRVFKACSNFFVVFPPSSFFEFSSLILLICDLVWYFGIVPWFICDFLCIWCVVCSIFLEYWICSSRLYYWIGKFDDFICNLNISQQYGLICFSLLSKQKESGKNDCGNSVISWFE